MSRGAKIVLAVVVIIVAIIVLQSCSRYNSLVTGDEAVKTAWAQVENVLKRRADLIPNLVSTVKGYAAHEKEVLIDVTEARAKVGQAKSIPESQAANAALSSALARLMVVVERYPDLKANTNFLQLQDELAGTENRIATERRRYNETVRAYNLRVRRFPGNIYASIFGFERATPFEASEADKELPKVDFGEGEE
ncbi:MAG: LemA family protein [Deltaproteobacteria bacterium]|nr:LemA family protein [Deltaproteobacteria bacterium]